MPASTTARRPRGRGFEAEGRESASIDSSDGDPREGKIGPKGVDEKLCVFAPDSIARRFQLPGGFSALEIHYYALAVFRVLGSLKSVFAALIPAVAAREMSRQSPEEIHSFANSGGVMAYSATIRSLSSSMPN